MANSYKALEDSNSPNSEVYDEMMKKKTEMELQNQLSIWSTLSQNDWWIIGVSFTLFFVLSVYILY